MKGKIVKKVKTAEGAARVIEDWMGFYHVQVTHGKSYRVLKSYLSKAEAEALLLELKVKDN